MKTHKILPMLAVAVITVLAFVLAFAPRAAQAQDYQSYKYQTNKDQFQYNFQPSPNGVCRDYTRNIHDGGGRRVVYGTVCPGTDGRWHMVKETSVPHKKMRTPARTLMPDSMRRAYKDDVADSE